MATRSSVLGQRIPWTEEPGGLQSIESDTTEATWYAHPLWPHERQGNRHPSQGHSANKGQGQYPYRPSQWRMNTPHTQVDFPNDSRDCKEIKPVHSKGNQFWIFIGRTEAEAEAPTLWTPDAKKRPWCWERLKEGGEGDDKRWDSWMASPTKWTWVWVDSGSWLWTGRPGVLWFMGSQTIRHESATELNWMTRGTVEKSTHRYLSFLDWEGFL